MIFSDNFVWQLRRWDEKTSVSCVSTQIYFLSPPTSSIASLQQSFTCVRTIALLLDGVLKLVQVRVNSESPLETYTSQVFTRCSIFWTRILRFYRASLRRSRYRATRRFFTSTSSLVASICSLRYKTKNAVSGFSPGGEVSKIEHFWPPSVANVRTSLKIYDAVTQPWKKSS